MEKTLQKSLIVAVIILSIAITIESIFFIKTVNSYGKQDIDVQQKEKEIAKRDSVINSYKVINDSLAKSNKTYIGEVDSLKHLKHVIYITPTEQSSQTLDEAYNEMIKELNKYKNEKSK